MAFTFDDQPYQRVAGGVTVRGFRELNQKFAALADARTLRRIGDEAVLAGARELLGPLFAAAPKRTRLMARSTRAFLAPEREFPGVSIAKAGPTWPNGAQAPLLEFGSKARFTQRPRKFVGRVRPRPFVGPTGVRFGQRVRQVMAAVAAAAVERELS